MCNPAIALAAVTVASTAYSAYSQNQQAKYASAVANQNADIAEAQADDAINRGNAQADEVRRRNRIAQGSQAAAIAAGGGDLSTGGSLDIMGDTAQFGELDALTTVNNASREAYGYQTQAANSRAEASSARSQANMGVFSTLLTAPLSAYGAYKMGGGTWNPFTQSKAAPISAAVGTLTGR
ncbi:hypothetical protein SMY44_000289 [Cronobacter sakazakii]|uniref:virion core protein, T7 gp14 family n=1 Tax=Cronobacter sakazakii TaxID=28141 RepID=UPI00190B1400|nr:hypothetical protein [Cronobacter sakazakii]ELY3455803.1 hypothetical protein [Cronobacter sakazakii]ELY4028031.1 hypothetical protein [Cronobacter sakazakii]MBK4112361.1 hypothetical protein [Cronobacter sakazakii]